MWIFNAALDTLEHADLWAECRKYAIKMGSRSESKVGWMGQMGLGSKDRLKQGQNHTELIFTSKAALLAILCCVWKESQKPCSTFVFVFKTHSASLSRSTGTGYYFEHICEGQCHVRCQSLPEVTSQCAQNYPDSAHLMPISSLRVDCFTAKKNTALWRPSLSAKNLCRSSLSGHDFICLTWLSLWWHEDDLRR